MLSRAGTRSGRDDDTGNAKIIRIEHLSRVFRSRKQVVTAVDDVSFSVHRRGIFGPFGPNGVGKGTAIRILTTPLLPSPGETRVGVFEVAREPGRVRAIIGVCPQNSTPYLDLWARDNLEFCGHPGDYPRRSSATAPGRS